MTKDKSIIEMVNELAEFREPMTMPVTDKFITECGVKIPTLAKRLNEVVECMKIRLDSVTSLAANGLVNVDLAQVERETLKDFLFLLTEEIAE